MRRYVLNGHEGPPWRASSARFVGLARCGDDARTSSSVGQARAGWGMSVCRTRSWSASPALPGRGARKPLRSPSSCSTRFGLLVTPLEHSSLQAQRSRRPSGSRRSGGLLLTLTVGRSRWCPGARWPSCGPPRSSWMWARAEHHRRLSFLTLAHLALRRCRCSPVFGSCGPWFQCGPAARWVLSPRGSEERSRRWQVFSDIELGPRSSVYLHWAVSTALLGFPTASFARPERRSRIPRSAPCPRLWTDARVRVHSPPLASPRRGQSQLDHASASSSLPRREQGDGSTASPLVRPAGS